LRVGTAISAPNTSRSHLLTSATLGSMILLTPILGYSRNVGCCELFHLWGTTMQRVLKSAALLGSIGAMLMGCAGPMTSARVSIGGACYWGAERWYDLTVPLNPQWSAGWGVTASTLAQCLASSQSAEQNFYAVHHGYQITLVEIHPCTLMCPLPWGGSSTAIGKIQPKRAKKSPQ
jgi:hypothetical protein